MNTFRKLIAVLAGCLILASCAQTGPPIPPSLELPKAVMDLRASRKGNSVTLMWTEPERTTDRRTVRYLGPTRICRTLESELNVCGTPLALVPPAPKRPAGSQAGGNTQTYIDKLPEDRLEQNPTADLTYAVEVFNEDKRSAGLSNRVRVPAVPMVAAPPDFSAQLAGDGVVLSWTSPGETSQLREVQHRYRIYRRDEAGRKDAVAGEVPADEAGAVHFLDSGLEWERAYLYRVTVVSIVNRSGTEEQVEGEDSSPVRIVAHDVFPPAVPAGLQAVYSGEGQEPFVDLIWAPVTNGDLAGYNIYRREENTSAVKLNSGLVKSPAYRDSAIGPSKTYWYSVSAVDARGNESARSEEASETVPEKQ
jgi:hypothetical protein